MLETTIYTPRSSYEHQPTQMEQPSFLRLPVELRLDIYKLVLEDVHTDSILIKRQPDWLYRRPKVPTPPPVLLVNKQIHQESKDILHELCFEKNALPIITIDRLDKQYYMYNKMYREDKRARPPPVDLNGIFVYESVRGLAPILRSLPRIKLVVFISQWFEQQVTTTAFLRWVKAVLNSRATAVRSFEVCFRITWPHREDQHHIEEKSGLVEAVSGIVTQEGGADVWVRCDGRILINPVHFKVDPTDSCVRGSIELGGRSRVELSEESAWEGMVRSLSMVSKQESEISSGQGLTGVVKWRQWVQRLSESVGLESGR